tara:strand:+ start:6924 stop:7511 length:588 start_codon:yes stop_codon:yes gene_type:complete
MPYTKEEIKHLSFVRRIREKNAIGYLSDRDVYLTDWINNPASRGGQAESGWESNNGKLLPGQVLNKAPNTEVNGRMVYNLYQDIQSGNISQGITFLSRQVANPNSATPSGYDVELTVNFVEEVSHKRQRAVPHSAVQVIDNRFKETEYLTSGTSEVIVDNTTSNIDDWKAENKWSDYSSGGGGGGSYMNTFEDEV